MKAPFGLYCTYYTNLFVELFIAPNTLYYTESKPSHKKSRAYDGWLHFLLL